jgi:RecG-like helicase
VLVRARGGNPPKVVVDPFLDSFGGRLAAYAAKPTDKAGVFQVIVSALASCTDPKIPNREKKLTLKLLARDNTKEIAQAFFSRQSKIHEMLEDGTYSLSYGKAKSCTVMLRWNTEDSAEYPYLEAIALKALDWNP